MTYATAADVKKALSIVDTDDDADIKRAVDAAAELVDDFTNRSFDPVDTADPAATTQRVYTAKSGRLLTIDDAAKIDQVEVRSGGWTAVDAAAWIAEPVNAVADGKVFTRLIRTSGAWPSSRQAVRVTAWFGWPATPHRVVQATVMQAERIFKEMKEAPLGIAPVGGFDGTSIRMMNKLHPQVEVQLGQLRRLRVAAPEVVTGG